MVCCGGLACEGLTVAETHLGVPAAARPRAAMATATVVLRRMALLTRVQAVATLLVVSTFDHHIVFSALT